MLIVDDEPFNVDYLEQELEDSGWDTLSAVNGVDALEKVSSQSPDLVLLDIMMPVMDGFEVLRRLKAASETRGIPVIVISASNDLQSVVRGIQLGAEDYLPKPFEPSLLFARISSSLEKKRLRDMEQVYLKGLERELDIAREIQLGFLPAELPQVDGWEFAAYFKAAREVAGDFYDAFELPDGNLAFCVGDVCGKGVGAALFMTLVRSLVRATALSDITSGGMDMSQLAPSERLQHVVSFVNRYICQTHGDANMFATLFIGIIDVREKKLIYANCGNEFGLLVRGGCLAVTLKPTGPVVGIIDDAQFAVRQVEMQPGDLLLAYTDGVPDALNAAGANFGRDQLAAGLSAIESSADGAIENLKRDLYGFIGDAESFDDITVVAVKMKGRVV